METCAKRLIDITLEELDEFLLSRGYRKEEKKEPEVKRWSLGDEDKKNLIRGDKELADYLGTTATTIHKLKSMGYLDGTFITPTPRRYVYFKDKVDALMMQGKKRRFSSR